MAKHLLIHVIIISGISAMSYGIEPTAVNDGLAIYHVGSGEPVFLMPYPHASATSPIAESELAAILTGIGRSVITFDPPGAFRSDRTPEVSMDEMLECTLQTLDFLGIDYPIDFIGHSMGSFCALAFSIDNQTKVRELILVGSTSGWPAVRKWGIQKQLKGDKNAYRKLMRWGFRIFVGLGNLAIHKKLDQLIDYASYVDKSYVREAVVEDSDHKESAPVRAGWPSYLRKKNVDYKNRLSELRMPVLICVGEFDPQTPVIMSEELHEGIRDSELVIFNKSGHSPFIEEEEHFTLVIKEFLE